MIHPLEHVTEAMTDETQPYEILDLLACRQTWRMTAYDLADRLSRPIDQVLHVVSHLTSMGLLRVCHIDGKWCYCLAAAQAS